ncbi:class I SAM-dependent methyltransferase [Ekhidna sp. To15]|uniref:class I SAM-dependent methyltransferase n=1 Tax=Ekhidna sp. To15 TaxID=3395267 RepID=UPI003F51E1ED
MKDNFSTQSDDYAKFRPVYSQKLIEFLLSLTDAHETCWDCGTGNGQLAIALSKSFQKVHATDISQKQLDNATQRPNIEYSKQSAEQTNFPNQHFDLITVAQAAHWFNHERFNNEVKRVLKPHGALVLFGYGLVRVDEELQPIIENFYWNVTKPYWDSERNHIEARYETIPFPYEEIEVNQNFDIEAEMTLDELTGYIGTWSAIQHYKKANGYHPVDRLKEDLAKIWKSGKRKITFPVFIRAGKL